MTMDTAVRLRTTWISLVVVVGGRCALEVEVLSLCWDGPGALERNETP